LKAYGTRAGEPFVKRVDGDIWELCPLRDRFFFFAWHGDQFVLLHHCIKKTQKAPAREIAQAKRNLNDFIEKSGNDA
jgi:phage-related protein